MWIAISQGEYNLICSDCGFVFDIRSNNLPSEGIGIPFKNIFYRDSEKKEESQLIEVRDIFLRSEKGFIRMSEIESFSTFYDLKEVRWLLSAKMKGGELHKFRPEFTDTNYTAERALERLKEFLEKNGCQIVESI